MKKNFLTNLLVLFACIASFSSCSNNDDEIITIGGSWDYASPHLQLEYNGNLTTDLGSPEMPNEQFIGMLTQVAHEKMSSYFKGIEFGADNKLVVNYIKDGAPNSFTVSYEEIDNTISISLSDILGQFDIQTPMDPSMKISFSYVEDGTNLKVYLITPTIKMFAAMFSNILSQSEKPDYIYLSKLISTMKEKTTVVEVGFNLTQK